MNQENNIEVQIARLQEQHGAIEHRVSTLEKTLAVQLVELRGGQQELGLGQQRIELALSALQKTVDDGRVGHRSHGERLRTLEEKETERKGAWKLVLALTGASSAVSAAATYLLTHLVKKGP